MKLFQKDSAFYKKVLWLALPIAGQSLITVGVNMLDTIMLGKIGSELAPEIGAEAAKIVSSNSVSAAAFANSFIGIYHILCMGLGMGASVLVSRYWGMKQHTADAIASSDDVDPGTAMKQTVSLMLRLTLGLALIFASLSAFVPKFLIGTYVSSNDPERANIIAYGTGYLRYSIPSFFFLGTSLVVTIVLRSVGQALYPLFVSIGALFVNLIGNYMLIFGKWGAPRMEVEGAALATLIARVFEATCILVYLFIIDKKIRFRIRDLFMSCKSLVGEYFRSAFRLS